MNILQKNFWKALGSQLLFWATCILTAMPMVLAFSLQTLDLAVLATYLTAGISLSLVTTLFSILPASISIIADYELQDITRMSFSGIKKCNPCYVYMRLPLKLLS